MNLFTETIEKNIAELPAFAKDHPGPYFVNYEVFAVRVHYKDENFKFSTKGKDNAFKSFWSEHRSFGNLFLDEIKGICEPEEFFGALNKSLHYYFLVPLRGTNRVMLSSAEEKNLKPVVFLSGVCDPAGSAYLLSEDDSKDYSGPWSYLPKIDPLNYSPEDYPSSVGVSYLSLGSPCEHEPRGDNYRLVRFIYPVFLDYKALRNNTADIYVRYGQLWKEHSPDIEYFKEHYREHIDKFDAAVDEIYESYKTRYITTKEFITVSPLHHAVLKKIRDVHLHRRWDTISKNNVYNIIFRHFHTKLFKL